MSYLPQTLVIASMPDIFAIPILVTDANDQQNLVTKKIWRYWRDIILVTRHMHQSLLARFLDCFRIEKYVPFVVVNQLRQGPIKMREGERDKNEGGSDMITWRIEQQYGLRGGEREEENNKESRTIQQQCRERACGRNEKIKA